MRTNAEQFFTALRVSLGSFRCLAIATVFVFASWELGQAQCTIVNTFSNTNSIAIPASGNATPYPSTLTVAGLGLISSAQGSVQVAINNFSNGTGVGLVEVYDLGK